MPLWMKTCFTPGMLRIFRSAAMFSSAPLSRLGQGVGSRQSRWTQEPNLRILPQRMRNMLALGPPTSLIVPLKPGWAAMRPASATTEATLRFWMSLPWW